MPDAISQTIGIAEIHDDSILDIVHCATPINRRISHRYGGRLGIQQDQQEVVADLYRLNRELQVILQKARSRIA